MRFEKVIVIAIVFTVLVLANLDRIYLMFKWLKHLDKLKFEKNSSENTDEKHMQK